MKWILALLCKCSRTHEIQRQKHINAAGSLGHTLRWLNKAGTNETLHIESRRVTTQDVLTLFCLEGGATNIPSFKIYGNNHIIGK